MTGSRKQCRSGDRCEPRSFVEAADCLGHHSDQSLPETAEHVGRTARYLGKAFSQYDEAHPLRGDLIVPVTRSTRNFVLVRYICNAVGGVFVRILRAEATNAEVFEAFTHAVKEIGEDGSLIHRCLEDGDISEDDAAKCDAELDQTQAAIEPVRAAIHSKRTRRATR